MRSLTFDTYWKNTLAQSLRASPYELFGDEEARRIVEDCRARIETFAFDPEELTAVDLARLERAGQQIVAQATRAAFAKRLKELAAAGRPTMDEAAFTEFWGTFDTRATRATAAALAQPGLAWETCQELAREAVATCFGAIWLHSSDQPDHGRLVVWGLRRAIWKARTLLRQRRSVARHLTPGAQPVQSREEDAADTLFTRLPAPEPTDPEEEALRRQTDLMVDHLPPAHAAVIFLDAEGYTYQEIADTLDHWTNQIPALLSPGQKTLTKERVHGLAKSAREQLARLLTATYLQRALDEVDATKAAWDTLQRYLRQERWIDDYVKERPAGEVAALQAIYFQLVQRLAEPLSRRIRDAQQREALLRYARHGAPADDPLVMAARRRLDTMLKRGPL